MIPFLGGIFASGLMKSMFGGNDNAALANTPPPQWVIDMRQELASLKQFKEEAQKEAEESSSPEKFILTEKKIFEDLLVKLKNFKGEKIGEELTGIMIAFMGTISAGKSSLINALFGRKVCKTGLGRCTAGNEKVGEIYGCSIHDVFGNSDSISYLEFQNLVFLKFMTVVVIVYDNSPSSSARLIRVCDALGVKFIVARNKVDNFEQSEDFQTLSQWKKEEEEEIKGMTKNKDLFQGLYFLSARNKIKNEDPSKFFDWETFVKHLSTIASIPAQ